MRLQRQRARALLFLLPLQIFAASIATDLDEKQIARAAAVAEYPDVSAIPSPSPASKATKDAPVDGLDGKPHDGPYVDGKPTVPKQQPAGIEELRPGATRISSTQKLTTEEWK